MSNVKVVAMSTSIKVMPERIIVRALATDRRCCAVLYAEDVDRFMNTLSLVQLNSTTGLANIIYAPSPVCVSARSSSLYSSLRLA